MQTVLITGSSGGIGKDLAEIFALNKYNLFLVARSKDTLEQIAADLQQRYKITVTVFATDLSKAGSAAQVHEAIQKHNITIDILINNAGVGMSGDFSDMNEEKLNDMMLLNMVSLTNLTRLFAAEMKQRRSGKILNVSSAAGFQPCPNMAVYGASKAYVLSFSEALYEELHKYGVTVSVLCPGATATGFARGANMESSQMFNGSFVMSSKAVAEKAYKQLMRGKITIVTGLMNKLLSESIRLVPRGWAAKISGQMLKH